MKWKNVKVREDDDRLPIYSWADVDEATMLQLANLSTHPVTWGRVCAMADAHLGFGMPIGGVIGCDNAVIPNAVGKDIGCGMIALCLNTHRDMFNIDTLNRIRERIIATVPLGFNKHKDVQEWDGFLPFMNQRLRDTWLDERALSNAVRSLGTLGGGK